MNIGAPWPDLDEAERRVLAMQTKLHQWAAADRGRVFNDLYNLVYDPAFLVVAWTRVRGNRGARSAGVDGIAPAKVADVGAWLADLQRDLKARRFTPDRVRERMIPKRSGKLRRLGIPTAADRVAQAALKLVLEPVFEADFKPSSYGFRPRRRAQDAIAEIHYLGSPARNYEWVFEADIALTRSTTTLCSTGFVAASPTGASSAWSRRSWPPGFFPRPNRTGPRSPAPHKAGSSRRCWPTSPWRCWTSTSRASGKRSAPTGRARSCAAPVFRPTDSSATRTTSSSMVGGTRADAEALWKETSTVLSTVGLRLSVERSRVCHIDEGFDFLGFRIQRRRWKRAKREASGLHLPVQAGPWPR